MFALLEHRTRTGAHWDLLVEVPDAERLITWRLSGNPLAQTGPIVTERIADHRRVYLEYEGPISGDRGEVRRLDRGAAEWSAHSPELYRLKLHGAHLAGMYEIKLDPASAEPLTYFRKVKSDPIAEAGGASADAQV